VLRRHGSGAGKTADARSKEEMNAQTTAFLDDCAIRLLCVFALDRFCDFVSDQVFYFIFFIFTRASRKFLPSPPPPPPPLFSLLARLGGGSGTRKLCASAGHSDQVHECQIGIVGFRQPPQTSRTRAMGSTPRGLIGNRINLR
jgi:hypothetical protein